MSQLNKETTKSNQTKIGTGTASSVEGDEGGSPTSQRNNKCGPKVEFIHSFKKEGNGLSTKVALGRLHDEIERILKEYEQQWQEERWYRKVRSAFVKRYDSPLGWSSIATSLLVTVALLIAQSFLAALCLAAILSLDLYVVVRENNLRRTEIYRKTRLILGDLHLAAVELSADWQMCNYPHICSPVSPCVSLQWTYRDGVVVNLPWALLVKGDYIVLRPGHITPGPCSEVNGKRSFNAHEIYGVSHGGEPPMKPIARSPLPDMVCCLESTPYLDNLKLILENCSKRPATIYNQQRYLLVTKYIQQWGFICAISITLFAGVLRLHGFGLSSQNHHHDTWVNVIIESPASAVIPLLPLIFPLLWISMNLWGVARLQCFLRTPQLVLGKDSEKSFEEDLDTPFPFDYENLALHRSKVFRNWLQLWQGNSELLPRSANLVQVLGSITALCCVDKKGILSWPNPTAEKVFFLHDTDDDELEEKSCQTSMNTESDIPDHTVQKGNGIVAEVLDLTHDQHCPFRLEFDDQEWKNHIKSLKPLGLAILLNTCSPLTHAHYAQFCGHVTAVAMLDKDLVPVTNRYAIVESSMKSFLHGRCLCELAKQIGFTDHACDRFTLEGQLATYRHLQPDVVRRDIRFARQLQLSSKVKVPFPHSLSVVMRENPGGYLSLFTQGTADIILDYCDDFWDGVDLRPLSPQDRKRALDFYQRSALTAYCTAFAYRPLRHGINGALSGGPNTSGNIAYLELPPETKLRMQHVDKMHCDFEGGHGKLSHSISTDSLLFSESKEEDITDVEGCFEMQCHQVFIGMVTMQYQAQTDIVQLVERLERACIRFVHFSKENELRSRVFSEKMGLESGWNCHISLLSETDDKMQSPKVASTTGKTDHHHLHHHHHNNHHHHTSNSNNNANNNVSSLTSTTTTTTTTATNNSITSSSHTNTQLTAITTTTCMTTTTTTTNSSTNPTITIATSSTNNRSSITSHEANEFEFILPTSSTTTNTTAIVTTTSDCHDNSIEINILGNVATDEDESSDLNYLLPPVSNLESSKTLSSSAPGAISNHDCNMLHTLDSNETYSNASLAGSRDSINERRRQSQDSALDENCRSLSILTESTEQSAPVHFDMSNRAKLPRGIENIRPHLEKVDNVPLQVSLFTDCSAEATRQMLEIMQSFGEIVVCLGSSASNSNAEIFLQADCSIAVEPLYPQVCQDIEAYTEANLINNKLKAKRKLYGGDCASEIQDEPFAAEELLEAGQYGGCSASARPMQSPGNTISPINLSRLMNSLPCSISVKREDPLSLVAIIELSRRFSSGLWNCIQFWACCAASLSLLNILSACLSLRPILTPLNVIYLMSIPVPLISLALAHIDLDPKIMNRATGKKQTEYDSRVFGFVLWCYGCKFLSPVLVLILSYCAFMDHPFKFLDVDDDDKHINLEIARIFAMLGILLHFVTVSASFVHRDHSLWQKNPFRNRIWALSSFCILVIHSLVCVAQILLNEELRDQVAEAWPAIVFLTCGILISLIVSEFCKWQEIKVNTRYQRRARLDFGTKLGMNSPF